MAKKSLEALPLDAKRVLIRVDYNVPLKDGAAGAVISDDTRIRESLPTLRHCLQRGAAIVLCAHLGRPKGAPNPKYSLRPAAERLGELLGQEIAFAADCVGNEAKRSASGLKPGQVLLLENLRFHPGEEKNDPGFAKELASLADFFVQDAFGAVHRAHASTSAVTRFLPAAAGFLLRKELSALGAVLAEPKRPFVAILGGAKVSDKLGVIKNLLPKADSVIIGGAMAYTFLKSKGIGTGKSLVEEDKISLAGELLKSSKKLVLPSDHRIAQSPDGNSQVRVTEGLDIPDGWLGADIGPETEKDLDAIIQGAKTIFWNGPLGIFEVPEFSSGTLACARSVARATKNGCFSVVGGGDSVSALKNSGLSQSISHISTGGGASLEFVEGRDLPGVSALPDAREAAPARS